MKTRLNSSLNRSFKVVVKENLLDIRDESHLSILDDRRVLIVTTPTVDKIYGDRMRQCLKSRSLVFEYRVLRLCESEKTIENVERVCEWALKHKLGRKDALVAFGGGVCTDIVAFAASMIRRGISHVRIPTTLIGQIDAGIGIKGGVNFRKKKNILGCFHPPEAVFIDKTFLATLRNRYIRQGLAEILKVAVVADRHLYEAVRAHGSELVESRFQHPQDVSHSVISRSISRTLEELQDNPFEDRTLERLLDFGHTFSPILEEKSEFTISHGEAVAIDMALSCVLAAELGIMAAKYRDNFIELLESLGLPIWSPLVSPELCAAAIRQTTSHRGGALNLVVPMRIGEAGFVRSSARINRQVIQNSIDFLSGAGWKKPSVEFASIEKNQQLLM
ncbi:MAG: sedoheptulose 7-phosphate cyclase [Woeseiaceae bacterium]